MANKEHKELANFLKEVHSSLRLESVKVGVVQAWHKHCKDKALLNKYAKCMEKLATIHWAGNAANESSMAESRIEWAANFCYDYFINNSFSMYRQKEVDIANKMNIPIEIDEEHLQPIKLIDVGSCYNPFRKYEFLDVTAIDLYPANDFVLECDFLEIPVGPTMRILSCKVEQLPSNYFNVVTFCFLLEYIPSSELRITACEKAYNILKPGGLLIINTPDSKHVGANSKMMQCWRYTLANIGFSRIRYEKLKHMHCMAFRKAFCFETTVRWAKLHKKEYMEQALHIPQDYHIKQQQTPDNLVQVKTSLEDFKELPFCDFF